MIADDIQRLAAWPRSVRPRQGESFHGFVLRQSAFLRLTPSDLALHFGLSDAAEGTRGAVHYMPLRAAYALSDNETQRIAALCSTDTASVQALTLTEYTNLMTSGLDDDACRRMGNSKQGQGWCDARQWLHCPTCLQDQPSIWPKWWLTPWAFACPQHERYLTAACPRCQTPVGTNGSRRVVGLINEAFTVLPATQCRARLNTGTCRYDLASTDTDSIHLPPPAHLAAQRYLLSLIGPAVHHDAPEAASVTTLGAPVSVGEHLRDLRTVMLLIGMVNGSAVTRGNADRQMLFTVPAFDPVLRASAAHQVLDMLVNSPIRAGTAALRALHEQACVIDLVTARKMKFQAHPSIALKNVISPKAHAAVGQQALRAHLSATSTTLRLTCLPPYLTDALYATHLAQFITVTERYARRGAALLLGEHLSGQNLDEVAVALGYPSGTPDTVLPRLGTRLGKGDAHADFRRALADLLSNLSHQPHINYSQRRHALDGWLLPQEDMTLLLASVSTIDRPEVADRWRQALTIRIWSQVTASDPSLHPLILTEDRHAVPKDARLMPWLKTRLTPNTSNRTLIAAVREYAEYLASTIRPFDISRSK